MMICTTKATISVLIRKRNTPYDYALLRVELTFNRVTWSLPALQRFRWAEH